MSRYYKLRIYQKGSNAEDFTVTNSSRDQAADRINYFHDTFFMLTKLTYNKALYSPCRATAVINIKATSAGYTSHALADKIIDWFGGKSIDIASSANGHKRINYEKNDIVIGKDYVIMQVRPVQVFEKNMEIRLTMFSRDKLLTLDKFSHSYLNQKLGADIIGKSLGSNGMLKACSVDTLQGTDRLQLMKYKKGSGTTTYELIQPYRLQYNEDFYSFVSRLACQCGEFLYFENGKLTLGLNTDETAAVSLKDRVKKSEGTSAEYTGDILETEYPHTTTSQISTYGFYDHYLQSKKEEKKKKSNTSGQKDSGLVYNADDGFDEYFDVFDEGVKPDGLGSELTYGTFMKEIITGWIPAFSKWKDNQPYLATGGFLRATKKMADHVATTGMHALYVNTNFSSRVFDNASKNTDNFTSNEQKDNKRLSQFSSVNGFENLRASFLSTIKETEATSAGTVIRLTLSTDTKIGLGDYVRLESEKNTDTSKWPLYVVTKVWGDVSHNNDIVTDAQHIEIVPKQKFIFSENDSSKNFDLFIPPRKVFPEPPRISAQTAIVTDSDDPRFLGRLRIKYPWQKESEKASPWIRNTTLMTINSGGVQFRPNPGDEVMVDYIGGNPDRPYVVGSLYNNDIKPEKYLYTPNSRIIRTEHGQMIKFEAGSFDPYFSQLIPAWGSISQYVPWTKDLTKGIDSIPFIGDFSTLFHGSLSLTDAFGLWTIKGDTAGREITIDSMAGKVTISALTGITISAPLGDIKIEGKNIDIKATNNITIESGVAIKNERLAALATLQDKGKTTGEMLGNVAKEMLTELITQKLDLSLFRTIHEAIFSPMEGTLRVKSHRYLHMEAGRGSAFDKIGTDPEKWFMSKNERAQHIARGNVTSFSIIEHISEDLDIIKNAVGLMAQRELLLKQNNMTYAGWVLHTQNETLKKDRNIKAAKTINDIYSMALQTLKGTGTQTIMDKLFHEYTEYYIYMSEEQRSGIRNKAISFLEKAIDFIAAVKSVEDAIKGTFNDRTGSVKTFLTREFEKQVKNAAKDSLDKIKDDIISHLNVDELALRREAYAIYINNSSDAGKLGLKILPVDFKNADEWNEAVTNIVAGESTSSIAGTESLGSAISGALKKEYQSWIEKHNKYGGEFYLKNPTAKGKILLSQERNTTYEILADGALQKNTVDTGNMFQAIQQKLQDSALWVAVNVPPVEEGEREPE